MIKNLPKKLRVQATAKIELAEQIVESFASQVLPSGELGIQLSLDTDHYTLEADTGRPIVTLAGASLAVPGRCVLSFLS